MAGLGVSLSVPLFSLGISKLVTKPKEYYMCYAAYPVKDLLSGN